MSPRIALLSPLALLPLVYAATPRGDRVTFEVEEGLSLEKTFEASLDVEMSDLAVSFGGHEIDPAMMGDPQIELSFAGLVKVSDEFGGSTDGRPTSVTRSYEEASMEVVATASAADGDDETTTTATSQLEGETVVFSWDEDEGAFVAAFADSGDDELLEGLEEDMDYRALLPAGEVAVDDSWEISTEALGSILMPGGDLALESEDAEDAEEMPEEVMEAIEDVIMDLFAGTTTATYRGMREEDGVQVAAIELSVAVDSSTDVSEIMATAIEASGEDPGVDFEGVDVALTFEGEGLLLWNVEGGHFHSFELSGDLFIAVDLSVSGDEMPGEIEASVEFEGSASFSSSAE